MTRFLLFFLLVGPAWGLHNQLVGRPSPYLAMHADDPVHWQEWGEKALELARTQDKLLFISSGYFSCHWCHVMQRESYRDKRIADLLNRYFIPVKLDRELHPALDAYLIDFLQRTQGQAGWPLNIFLTPEGYPLVGATYLPVDRFATVLQRLQQTWEKQRAQTRNLARRALLQVISERNDGKVEPLPDEQLRERLVREALALGDPMEGGFGEQNKFPMAPQLLALLEVRGDTPHRALDALLLETLQQMAQQGLRDHLAGGFFRYTVDPSWQVPHFEKMLYTQAQLARVYLVAGERFARPDFLQVARQTLDFVLREMTGPNGLLIASFSAVDETGEEGAAYLWRPEQLLALLGEQDAALAQRYWSLAGGSTVGGAYLPRQGEPVEQLVAELGGTPAQLQLQLRLEAIRQELLHARSRRPLPADTKELAGWNGLMIGALARAARVLGEPAYGEAAVRLATTLRQRLWRGGELWRATTGERSIGVTSLADYAYLAEGLQQLINWQQDRNLSGWLGELVEAGWRRFHREGGWRSAEDQLLPGIGGRHAEPDGALPSPPAVLMRVSSGLGGKYAGRVLEKALRASRARVQGEPFWYATHLLALLDDADQGRHD